MFTTRTVFLIPEANIARLERDMAKLSKRAEKLGLYAFGSDLFVIGHKFRETQNGTKIKLLEVSLDVGNICFDGWEFIARLDHSQETGTIIRTIPNTSVEVPIRYRDSRPDCDHCGHKRARRDTFLVHNADTGETKQIGSTCLSDFLGHDVGNLGRFAELASYAMEAAKAAEREVASTFSLTDHRYINLDDFLGYCVRNVRNRGWVSGKAAWENKTLVSTREAAINDVLGNGNHALEEADIAYAEKALAYVQGFANKAVLSDFEHNILVIANSAVIEMRACGLAAAIVGCYNRVDPVVNRAKPVNVGDMAGVIALFNTAGSRLKNPKVEIEFGGVGSVTLMMLKTGKHPGSISIKSGKGYDAPWFGRIHTDGRFEPSRIAPQGLDTALLAFAADPAGVAAQHGHKTGQCCFCSIPLRDARSVFVGYGATCAKHFALPYPKMSEVRQAA